MLWRQTVHISLKINTVLNRKPRDGQYFTGKQCKDMDCAEERIKGASCSFGFTLVLLVVMQLLLPHKPPLPISVQSSL